MILLFLLIVFCMILCRKQFWALHSLFSIVLCMAIYFLTKCVMIHAAELWYVVGATLALYITYANLIIYKRSHLGRYLMVAGVFLFLAVINVCTGIEYRTTSTLFYQYYPAIDVSSYQLGVALILGFELSSKPLAKKKTWSFLFPRLRAPQ